MYCLDSCICLDFLRGKTPDFYKLLRATDPKLIKIPAIVSAELLLGAEKCNQVKRSTLAVEEFISPFEILPFTQNCAYEYAKLRADLEAQGQVIGANEMLIAATAIANHATLITNNAREFKRIPNFSLECLDMASIE